MIRKHQNTVFNRIETRNDKTSAIYITFIKSLSVIQIKIESSWNQVSVNSVDPYRKIFQKIQHSASFSAFSDKKNIENMADISLYLFALKFSEIAFVEGPQNWHIFCF